MIFYHQFLDNILAIKDLSNIATGINSFCQLLRQHKAQELLDTLFTYVKKNKLNSLEEFLQDSSAKEKSDNAAQFEIEAIKHNFTAISKDLRAKESGDFDEEDNELCLNLADSMPKIESNLAFSEIAYWVDKLKDKQKFSQKVLRYLQNFLRLDNFERLVKLYYLAK